MRLVRLTTVSCYPLALALGSLGFLGGCGENSGTATPGAVKEAPPMTPDEKKVWESNYDMKKGAGVQKPGARN